MSIRPDLTDEERNIIAQTVASVATPKDCEEAAKITHQIFLLFRREMVPLIVGHIALDAALLTLQENIHLGFLTSEKR